MTCDSEQFIKCAKPSFGSK